MLDELHEKLNRHLEFLAQDKDNLSLLLEICSLYQELNDPDSAQSYLDKANVIDREASLAHQGLVHLHRGFLDKATDCFSEAFSYADIAPLRYNLGLCHYLAGEFEQSRQLLLPVVEKEYHPDVELLMARILHQQNSLDEAVNRLVKLLELNPTDAHILGFLALLYYDLNEEAIAKDTAKKALKLDPDNYDARLVSILTRIMTHETTVAEIEELIQRNPNDSRLWFALGNTFMSLGEVDSAEHAFQKCIDLYPSFYDCYIALAWCLLLQDKLSDAETVYTTAAHLLPQSAESWAGLGLIHALRDEFSKAETYIYQASELDPDCIIISVAQSILFNNTNPRNAKKNLIDVLTKSSIPASADLAFLMEEFEHSDSVH